MKIRLRTNEMLNCSEITAMAVLVARAARERIVKRDGEPVTYGCIDLFTTDKGNTIRFFTDLDTVSVDTNVNVKGIAVEEIFWRVTGQTPEMIMKVGN